MKFKHVNIQQVLPWAFTQFNTQCFAVLSFQKQIWCHLINGALEEVRWWDVSEGQTSTPTCKMTDDTGGCTHTAFKLPLCSEGLRPGNRKIFLQWLKKPKRKSRGRLFLGLVSVTQNLSCCRRQDMCLLPCLQKNKVINWKQRHYLEKGTSNAAGLGCNILC